MLLKEEFPAVSEAMKRDIKILRAATKGNTSSQLTAANESPDEHKHTTSSCSRLVSMHEYPFMVEMCRRWDMRLNCATCALFQVDLG